MLFHPICRAVYDVGFGHAWPWEIDQYGPGEALQLSYRRALEELHPSRQPTLLYVDGSNHIAAWKGRQIVEPKADAKYKEVSAASIVAKVFRDTIMVNYAKTFRQYGWDQNKGYGTADHTEAIKRFGLLVDNTRREVYLHRQRFCRNLTKK
jgi:ribonuclease HII